MAHPDVLEAAVVAIPDEKWDERPLATVVLREGASADLDSLREHLATKFAKWQLPDAWAFIESVPRTSRRQVRQEGHPPGLRRRRPRRQAPLTPASRCRAVSVGRGRNTRSTGCTDPS